MTRESILNALAAWIKQRPGLEFGNYGDMKSYRAELRQIAKDRRDAETLLRAVALRPSITAKDLIAATRAYSGRLQIKPEVRKVREPIDSIELEPSGRVIIDYCTGQYWPTEYRKAACAVLASALWEDTRVNIPTDSTRERLQPGVSAGDWIRNKFRREFGPSIAQRWFN